MNTEKKYCRCGCGQEIRIPPSVKWSKSIYLKKRNWVQGHNRAGAHGFYVSKNPTPRLFRSRARRIVDTSSCFINNADCSVRIEVAHIDQDCTNNDISNIRPLCVAHHRILDQHYEYGMRFEHLAKLKLSYYISSNKRRYHASSFMIGELDFNAPIKKARGW